MTLLARLRLAWALFKDWLAEHFTLAPDNHYKYVK